MADSVISAAHKEEIFPSVIDEFEPAALVISRYADKDATSGTVLSPAETAKQPQILVTPLVDLDHKDSYTLLVTDPDAPSRQDQKYGEVAHHVISGLKITAAKGETQTIDLSAGQELMPYLGPGPPPQTGLHRYITILYRETGKAVVSPKDRLTYGTGISGYGAREWSALYDLKPVAIDFFLSQNDDN